MLRDRWCKSWIERFALGGARLILAEIRGKYGALPGAGDKLYNKTRANDRFLLEAGHYKVVSGRSICSVEINKSGAVAAVTICRS